MDSNNNNVFLHLLAVACPLPFLLLLPLPLPCSLTLTLSLLLLFFLLVLDPHFEALDGIFSSFWQPLGTLGATLGAIGHHLGNHVDPRVKMTSSSGAPGQLRCPIWGTFLSMFQPKFKISLKTGFPKQSRNQMHLLFDFCAISVTPGP